MDHWFSQQQIAKSFCQRLFFRAVTDMYWVSSGVCPVFTSLHSIYTDDCRSNHLNRFVVKFADDSALLSLLQGSEQYIGPALTEFVDWCDNSYLDPNVTKTKEMIVDFRRPEHSPGKTIIHTITKLKLSVSASTLAPYLTTSLKRNSTEETVKKGQQRLYLLRKLNYFSVDQKILTLFYTSFIESVLSFSFICWFHSLGMKNRNILQRIVRIASKITAVPQRDLALFCEQQILLKARSILTEN